MGIAEVAASRFGKQLRAERTRRGLTQFDLANLLAQRYGVELYGTTIAKIESGSRAVRIDELSAFADLFGVSTDALIGRPSNGSDVAWAASKLTSNAHKAVNEILALQGRIADDAQDLIHYAKRDGRQVDTIFGAAATVCEALQTAAKAMKTLADEFPLVGSTRS